MTTNEQARADAIADAATLRAHTAVLIGSRHPAWVAAYNGTLAGRAMWKGRDPERAYSAAIWAARAAFRAVPALGKGDK